MLRIDTKGDQNEVITILVATFPNKLKTYPGINCRTRWKVINYKAMLVGYLNGRVGMSKQRNYPIGPYGKDTKNSNGKRIIHF